MNIKNITAFTSKSKIKPVLQSIHVMPDKIVATDSFKLIEVIGDTGAIETFNVIPPKGLKTFDKIERKDGQPVFTHKNAEYKGELVLEDFPEYEQVIPKTDPVLEITISPAHLKEVCAAFESKDDFSGMQFAFHGKTRPIVITNKKKDIRVLLMPINS